MDGKIKLCRHCILGFLLLSADLCKTQLFFTANLLLCNGYNSRMVGKWLGCLLQTTQTATQHLLFLWFFYQKAKGFCLLFLLCFLQQSRITAFLSANNWQLGGQICHKYNSSLRTSYFESRSTSLRLGCLVCRGCNFPMRATWALQPHFWICF